MDINQLRDSINQLSVNIHKATKQLNIPDKEKKLVQLKEQMSAPSFWNDQNTARSISVGAAEIGRQIKQWSDLELRVKDLESVAGEKNAEELLAELEKDFEQLQSGYQVLATQLMFAGKYDDRPAIMTINAGAGGVDAQDWAEMLERMYLRFAQQNGWTVSYLSRSAGAEAGIKSATFKISGPLAYGHLKNESGVHRLVRLSPYDADNARHTSFAMAEVLPEIPEQDIAVKEDDLKFDFFRSGGHGGQSVNKTDSAVRVTHLPTGITAVCQNERSQMQNKKQALTYLMSRLEQYQAAKTAEERQLLRGEYTEAAWGNQIRSYVLHPYKMVKDHRTDFESKDPESVLDGQIMPFIRANLEKNI